MTEKNFPGGRKKKKKSFLEPEKKKKSPNFGGKGEKQESIDLEDMRCGGRLGKKKRVRFRGRPSIYSVQKKKGTTRPFLKTGGKKKGKNPSKNIGARKMRLGGNQKALLEKSMGGSRESRKKRGGKTF